MHKTKNFPHRIGALVLASVFTIDATAMSMQQLFDEVNAQGNISTPAVVQGQTMNMLSGGSMFMRMPNRTYNMASFTPPSYNTGCGGIDLFAGGFSFINKEQFVAMMRNIGSNALGYGFKLAIQNLCPTCDNVMQALQATAQMMNKMNVDSCEAAKGVVQAALPDSWAKVKTNSAKMLGVDGGTFTDVADAWINIASSQPKTNEQIESAASRSPDLKDTLPSGNIVWKSLKKIQGLDNEYKEIIMSLTGTVIFSTKQDALPMPYPATGITVESLIGGNHSNAVGQTGEIDLEFLKCDEYEECLKPKPTRKRVDGFRVMVRAKLEMIMDQIANRSSYPFPNEIMLFLNTTDVPIYKMLAVTTSLSNTTIAQNMINKYQELIAAKYAEVYLQRAVADLRVGMAMYMGQADASTAIELEKLRPQMEEIERKAKIVVATAYSQTVSTYNIGQEVAYMERAMTANLSSTLRASLAFSKSLN